MGQRYTAKTVIKAIENSFGIKTHIAKRLGCSRGTVDNYISRYQTVRQAYEDERGRLVDTAQTRLLAKVDEGDAWAVQFVLKTMGKAEGFVEHSHIEVTGKNDTDLFPVEKLVEAIREARKLCEQGDTV